MQVYAMKFHNFLRFGEENNTVVFDLSPSQKKSLADSQTSMDEIYEEVSKDPIGHIKTVKDRGIEQQIGIMGVVGGDPDSSNGAGKSSLLDGMCYSHYEKIVRKTANTDKIEKAGLSVVTKLNGKYPKGMKESYVEEFLEDNGSIYRIKRGKVFSKSQKNPKPILEFECINDSGIESRSSHRTGDTNKSIADVITMDYDVFVNSQMFGQNDAGKYLTGTDKTKKEMLINLLRLENVVQGCLEVVRKKKNEKDKVVQELQASTNFIEEMVMKLLAKYSDEEFDAFDESVFEKLSNVFESLIQNGKEKLDKCEKKKSQIQESMEKLSNQSKIIEVRRVEEERKQILEQKEGKEKEKNEMTLHLNELIENLKDEIKKSKDEILVKNKRIDKATQDEIESKEKIQKFDREKYEKKLDVIDRAKKAKPDVEKKIEIQKKSHEEIIKKIASLSSKELDLKDEIRSLKEQISNVEDEDGFVCQKCKSHVPKSHILQEIESNGKKLNLIHDESEKLNLQNKECDNFISDLNSKMEKINKYLLAEGKMEGELKAYEAINSNLMTLQGIIDVSKKEISLLNENIASNEVKLKEYQGKLNSLEVNAKEQLEKINSRLDEIEISLKDIRKEAEIFENKLKEEKELLIKVEKIKSDTNEKIGSLEKEKQDNEEFKTSWEEKRNAYLDHARAYQRYMILEGAYGLDGIQTRIVNKYLPLLNVYIKEFLDILSRGSINVSMQVNERSKIDMKISGASAETYEMLSGGEKMIVRLAVDIGLALLSFSRSLQKPEIICLDEIFGPLDNNNSESVFEMLKKLQDKFSRVLIITHNPEIQKRLESNIIIEKGSGAFGLSAIKRIE